MKTLQHVVVSACILIAAFARPCSAQEITVTWSPSDKGVSVVLSNGNLDAAGSGAVFHTVRATVGRNEGKRCFEGVYVAADANASLVVGLADAAASLTSYPGASAKSAGVQWIASPALTQPFVSGITRSNGFSVVATAATSSVAMVCVDFVSGHAWFGLNGAWASGNPATGASPSLTGLSGLTLFPAIGVFNAANKLRIRTAAADLQYLPSGFVSWAEGEQLPPIVSAPTWTATSSVTYLRRSNKPMIEPLDVWSYLRVTSAEAAASVRSAALSYVYRTGRTPSSLSAQSFTLPVMGQQSSERWTVSLPNNLTSQVFFLSAPTDNGCLFIYHAGHEETTIYTDAAVSALAASLLGHGCDVLLISMPAFGVNAQSGVTHDTLGTHASTTFSPFVYNVEPVMRSIDEALARKSYSKIGMAGLSGGGWTTTFVGALDSRITAIYPVAGSMPFEVDVDPSVVGGVNLSSKRGDWEQSHAPFYNGVAGYMDLYLLSAQGRRAMYFYLANDNCCFPAWAMYAFSRQLPDIARDIGGRLIFREDPTAASHMLSSFAAGSIVADFAALP